MKVIKGKTKILVAQATKTVTISTSTDGLSGAVDLGEYKLTAIEMSTAWTNANITFAAASASNGTFYPLYDDNGAEATVATSASRVVAVDVVAASLAPIRHLKLRSGSNDTPVTQAAARTLTLILKG